MKLHQLVILALQSVCVMSLSSMMRPSPEDYAADLKYRTDIMKTIAQVSNLEGKPYPHLLSDKEMSEIVSLKRVTSLDLVKSKLSQKSQVTNEKIKLLREKIATEQSLREMHSLNARLARQLVESNEEKMCVKETQRKQ